MMAIIASIATAGATQAGQRASVHSVDRKESCQLSDRRQSNGPPVRLGPAYREVLQACDVAVD